MVLRQGQHERLFIACCMLHASFGTAGTSTSTYCFAPWKPSDVCLAATRACQVARRHNMSFGYGTRREASFSLLWEKDDKKTEFVIMFCSTSVTLGITMYFFCSCPTDFRKPRQGISKCYQQISLPGFGMEILLEERKYYVLYFTK